MEKTEIETLLLATPMQESMVFSTLTDPGAGHYILQLTFELHGEHQCSLLQDAWQTLLQRHTALRTQFVWKRQEKLRQLVRNSVTSDVEIVNLTKFPAAQQNEECKKFLARDKNRGFALDRAPLTRLSALELSGKKKYYVWTFHHSVVDGWSIAILFKELCATLAALTNHLPAPFAATVEPLEKLVDHIRSSSESAKAFWQLELANTQQHHSLAAIAAPHSNAHSHCTHESALDATASEVIYAACRAKRITFASLALAGWSLLLAYYSGRDDVLFGSISSGRGSLGERGTNTVGLLISLVPIRVTLDMQTSLDDYLSEIQHQHMLRNEHEHLAPGDSANILNIEPGTPLFDSMLVVENHPGSEQLSPESRALGVQNVLGYEQSDTPLAVSIGADAKITSISRFHGDKFTRANIAALVDFYFSLLSRMAKTTNPMPLAELLPSLEVAPDNLIVKNASVGDLNQRHLVELFNEQVVEHPNNTALHYRNVNVSYAELADHAEEIRRTLLKSGICGGDTVAVYMDRSPACIASMLAILALDACYLPLDPVYPAQRLDFMLRDSDSRLVLCAAETANEIFSVTTVQVPEQRNDAALAHLALSATFKSPYMCLIYTSGSTGQPKGVKLRHNSMLNRCQWMWREFPFKETEVCCHRTPLGFVDSVCEIFSPLCQGIPIVVVDSDLVRDLNALINLLGEKKVSRITVVPTLLDAILEALEESRTQLPALQFWSSSGEPLPRLLAERFQRLMPGGRLLNLYGSTEVAADALFFEATANLPKNAIVPIGEPITATRACVLNARGQPLPAGVRGELCIGGTAVADGYHNRSEEAAAKFITLQNSEGAQTYYCSGDLALMDTAGIFHYRGRLDRQLKVRGQRVEPAEVESILRENSDVTNAVVFQSPDDHLIGAFTTGNDAQVATSTLMERLEQALPSFLLPQHLIEISAIPLNSSGKVDYTALQALCDGKEQPLKTTPSVSNLLPTSLPQQAIFSIIQNIWQELLPDEPVQAQHDFFQLGGQSLMAMRMIARIERRLGVSIALPTLMNSPLLADFAAAVCEGKTWSNDNELLTLKAAKGKPGLFCVHGDAFNLAPHFSGEQAVYWLSQWPKRM
ncbi:MAG: non-ribosomal peptide synthetase, partial [Pseudomonadales bacterium]